MVVALGFSGLVSLLSFDVPSNSNMGASVKSTNSFPLSSTSPLAVVVVVVVVVLFNVSLWLEFTCCTTASAVRLLAAGWHLISREHWTRMSNNLGSCVPTFMVILNLLGLPNLNNLMFPVA